MKSLKRMISGLAACLLTCMMTCLPAVSTSTAWAAEELPDPGTKGSISVRIEFDNQPVPGGSLKLYKVARIKVNGQKVSYKLTGDFKGCGKSLDGLDTDALGDKQLAEDLATYAEENRLKSDSLKVSKEGKAYVKDLPIGLYLIMQDEGVAGYKLINPFLVSIPQHDDQGELSYNVNASPKVSSDGETIPSQETIGTTTDDETPEQTETIPGEPPRRIIKTGQLWWPVPVLAAAGLFFFCLGWKRRSDAFKEED